MCTLNEVIVKMQKKKSGVRIRSGGGGVGRGRGLVGSKVGVVGDGGYGDVSQE